MSHQELRRDLTESYLKSLISEVCDSLSSDFDSLTAFGELGIDSFYVLKIVRRLEADFGTLPKSLLFEHFRISELANYFVTKHAHTIDTKFAAELKGAVWPLSPVDRRPELVAPMETVKVVPVSVREPVVWQHKPVRILESKARTHPELGTVVQDLYEHYKYEGTASRGTRKIAPNLFIGGSRRGYFNYGRSKNIILVYGYSGPPDYLATLREEMFGYCEANSLQLNFFNDGEVPPIAGRSFSATPFGVMQRIVNLKEFSLEGGAMRRLRYQVSKFQKAGAARTEEYRCGTNVDTDLDIARVIDRWCEGKTMVNPLVHEVKAEILAGTLPTEHRLFLTRLDAVLQNVILVDEMSAEINGYLMDLEFYPPGMPMGGLDFAIVQIAKLLAAEGRDVLSLGGTYGVKSEPSAAADPEIDKLLDELREQNIFNDESNLQFKNKFRPLTRPILLCRPVGSSNPDNVIDIIMMIADPEKMQTPDEEPAMVADDAWFAVAAAIEVPAVIRSTSVTAPAANDWPVPDRGDRSRALSESGFNPLNIPGAEVEIDLKTDSWSQLEMPAIAAQMKQLHSQLQQPTSVEESLRAVFPFSHFVLTTSGQAAESVFFRAWPKKGLVPQNLLFPSTIFHQIDKGFTPKELPNPAVFQLHSRELFQGNMDLDALKVLVAQSPAAIACVCVDVGNNASGGQPVSLQHLRDVQALLAANSIPLVIDGTRVVENAQLLIEREKECAGKSIWAVVREIFSCADAVFGSLTKDFCVNKGGIIAINDVKLFQRLQELVEEEGVGLDLIDTKLIALSVQNRKHVEASVLRRVESVRLIWQALVERGVPVSQPAGGHCILIDVKQISEFAGLGNPVASFLAWMYASTGIRGGAHSVGMQKRTSINDLVRLAIPLGLAREQVQRVIDRLTDAFEKKVNIPEIIMESSAPQSLGNVYAKYRLEKYHNSRDEIAGRTDGALASVAGPLPVSKEPVQASSPQESSVADRAAAQTPSGPDHPLAARRRRTQDIAIVGMAGRYPKAANLRELWENLAKGRDCVEEIPAERYERRLQYGSSEKYRGGFIDGVDKFDSLFFNISPREAEMLDPQERLFLEVAWEAIEDAGYYPEILAQEDASRSIGVFVGAVWAMYQIVGVDEQRAGNEAAPNSFLWSIANRVSYWMNLSGPSLTVDTACSSSLTALYLACEAIHAGECSAALVGGVNLDLHQAKLDINKIGGALSPDGVCRTFGKGANGYVAGEGIGALLLKTLEQAELDGDHVYGVIKGAVVNHGGRTSGYFVPNPSAQKDVIVSALHKANVAPRSIGYIEAHGTGTELGDPIEISGLISAFSEDEVGNQTCAIGSIKSNIGHLEAAAGVVAVSKVLLQMAHRQLVPSLHSSETNEHIDFEHSPFYVVQTLEEWKGKEVDGVRLPLRAGISSFGAGGANAHVILESYEPAAQGSGESVSPPELIFPLSARNEDQLFDSAARLAQFLRQNRVDVRNVAHTLQQGRKSFEQRLAIIARTQDELIGKLTSYVDRRKADDVVSGHAKLGDGVARLLNRREKQEFVRMLSTGRDPHKIAALWVEGLLGDWQGFQSNGGRRMSLPTYPFAGKRLWVGNGPAERQALRPAAGMHPMVDTNESTFERQLFKKTFHDRDFFIYDHRVSDIPTLPGVAYLELARIAGEIAAGRPVRRIQNILWVSPIVVENSVPKEVFIELKPSGDAVQFEVFSEPVDGARLLHSQGRLLYTNRPESAADPEFMDLEAIRARCAKDIDIQNAYPLFKSVGLNLGPSFQVLQEVCTSDKEVLGTLRLPEFREGELQSMALHPSLIDGSLQAGMAARLGDSIGEMLVPYSIGEVEILHPLQSLCYSYTTEAANRKGSRVLKSNVLILDGTGKVLARIRESTGVPLTDIHEKPPNDAEAGDARVCYSYEWEKASLVEGSADRYTPQATLVFDTRETLRDLYQARLRESGVSTAQTILVRPGAEFRELEAFSYEINPESRDDFTRLFELLAQKNCTVDEICFAWPVGCVDFRDETLRQEALQRGVFSFLFLCQSVIQARLESAVQLLYLYCARPNEGQPHNEAINGFVKTLNGEYPRLLCKALEVRQENGGYSEILDAVWAELRARSQDASVVRYEAQERYTRKLKLFDIEETEGLSSSEGSELKEKGVYLITGGAGGLGFIFAEFLAKQYKARLILTGRSALPAEREGQLEVLRGYGAEVVYLPADVSSIEEVRALVSDSKARFGEINGVIHAAGVVRDSYIRNKTAEEMRAVFASKVHGTLCMDEVTRSEALDFFVMFSSLAAVTGNVGQCDYSFANHFMDSFGADRERLRVQGERSGKTLSINWSLWAGGGMRPDEQTELLLRKTMGMTPLSTARGLEAFVLGLASGRSQFAVLEGNAEKLGLALGGRKKEPAAALPPSGDGVAAPAATGGDGDLRELLQNDLSQIVMELLKIEKADMSADKILLDLGFDSIGLTTFANAVNDKLQLDITPILFFDYPSIGEIAKHLADERKDEVLRFYRGSAAAPPAVPSPEVVLTKTGGTGSQPTSFAINKGWNPAPDRDATEWEGMSPVSGGSLSPERRFVDRPIAIVGMSGVMPQSQDLEEFWENLKSSKDLVTIIPPDRWRWEDYFGDPLKEANKSNSKWGAFMKEIDKFDPLFFGISPREAQMMDPQQRIFLEQVWKAVEDSGQKVSQLAGTKTGLFVGVATNDYLEVITGGGAVLDGYSASGNSHAILANRVSFLLGLRGPSAPLDTACSSSLVAMHRAIESIHTGSCEMAIVGGVQVMLSPAAYISFSSAGMLSPDGKCKTFDKLANGYVRGEGCGAVFIKTLAAAEADGNHIYAVIRATAENHGGRVTAMTAPNASAQAELLIEAYESGHVDPASVGYIECHGTGTSLGDPIETQALGKAFAELYKRHGMAPAETPHCGLSSVKTNIGHLETAAGIAGILKVLLAIKHQQIPANIHLEEVNPYINFKGTPFYIADKLTPWNAPVSEDGTPGARTAGVSSFGFGGANAHVVLQEHLTPIRRLLAASHEPRLIVLSAKNVDRLQAYMQAMQAYLERPDVELIDLAYTLQIGRDEMPARVAMVVSSTEELKQKIGQVLGGELPRGIYRGLLAKSGTIAASVESDADVQALIERKDLAKLAELWVSGAKIEWCQLYEAGVPRRISAPTYPFARERHWVQGVEGSINKDSHQKATAAVAHLHPLIHRNASTFDEQKFSTRFSGDEFYLTDHVVETQKTLPGVAYLEMARAAGELAANASVRVIRGLIWERPLNVGSDAREVEVALTPAKNEVKFVVRTVGGDHPVTHCTGRLGYEVNKPAPERLDISGIRKRCSEQVMSHPELYSFLSGLGLHLGKGFQIVRSIYATETESLAILELPEHLKSEAEQFWLHPALMDGSLHTAIGLMKANGMNVPLSLPYSVGEVQILHSLRDLRYGYATWGEDSKGNPDRQKITFQLLDENGTVLVQLKDFVNKPLPARSTKSPRAREDQQQAAPAREELKAFLPVWNPLRLEPSERVVVPESSNILVIGDSSQFDWVATSYPNAQFLDIVATSSVDVIEQHLVDRRLDQLLWLAPDVTAKTGLQTGLHERIIEQQEEGVLAVFRTIKALLQQGYGNKKLQWTLLTSRTQRVTAVDAIQPAHAGVVGLVGSMAKEYPRWDLRLLDIDSLVSVSARECLSLPWDKQGDALAHRHGEWFQQGLALIATLPEAKTAYRQNGVYVVIGGAGGVGEVWSRFMIENYQASIVWIGRHEYNPAIEAKIAALSKLGPAPLYISADATDELALGRARATLLEIYSAIHGVVHSAIVLRDQSLSRMDEQAFRASLSAKIDVSVNMDRVFGQDDLDLMLFFSSIISMVKSPGQSNYAAGCTFKDSFAHMLQQRRPYAVKIMNWGYWGNVGVVADEAYNKIMRQMGIGSIEPHEGMSSLQALVGSEVRQMALMKTLNSAATAGLHLSEAITFHPKTAPMALIQVEQVLAAQMSF